MEGFCFFDPIRYNKRYDVKSAGGQLRTMARKLDLPVSEIVSGAVASVLSKLSEEDDSPGSTHSDSQEFPFKKRIVPSIYNNV